MAESNGTNGDLNALLAKLEAADQTTDQPTEPVPAPALMPPAPLPTGPALVKADIDLARVFEDFERDSAEVLKCWREDRAKATDAINRCEEKLQDESAPGLYVESLVKALQVRSESNLTAVRVLDAKSKLIVAVKGQVNILNNNSLSTVDKDLEAALSQPPAAEDDA